MRGTSTKNAPEGLLLAGIWEQRGAGHHVLKTQKAGANSNKFSRFSFMSERRLISAFAWAGTAGGASHKCRNQLGINIFLPVRVFMCVYHAGKKKKVQSSTMFITDAFNSSSSSSVVV